MLRQTQLLGRLRSLGFMAYKVLAVLTELEFLRLVQLLTATSQVFWTLTVDVQEGAVGENFDFAVV